MKKLLTLLAIIGLLASCTKDVHLSYPLVVNEVTNVHEQCDYITSKYKITVYSPHTNEKVEIYTDKLFNVGDTIK